MQLEPHRFSVGDLLCGTPYRVHALIACGGMGAVYEVEDESLGKRFALKTLHPALAGAVETEQRLRGEARLLGRLSHPNIVQVFTAGATHELHPVPFLVMELLVGATLRQTLTLHGALGLRAAVRVTLDLLAALEQAHDLALVHRDIKPDNIFLHANRRGERSTKLLDFGVAERLSEANRDPARFAGTFRYASPEQVSGQPLCPASDLYSVGLVLFEMLVGSHPFAEARGRQSLIAAHLQQRPKLPRWPEPIRALVSSALAKSPRERPRDAWTFASRLRAATRALGVDIGTADLAPPPTPTHSSESLAETRVERTVSSRDTLHDDTLEVSREELIAHAVRGGDTLHSRGGLGRAG